MSSRSVLLVAFHCPPCAGSGTLRAAKFAKYLPEHGWSPVVLTVRESVHPLQDDSLLGDMPASPRVLRTRAYDSARLFGIRGKYPGFVAVPDRYLTWLPFAKQAAARAIHDEAIRAVYTTSPMPTAHLIGLALKRRYDLPWIADFRDPWVTPAPEGRSAFRVRYERRLERRVLSAADAVLVTCDEFREYLRQEYPDLSTSKFHVVSNGFDENDFAPSAATGESQGRKFVLSHVGHIYPGLRDPRSFFVAVRAALDKHPELEDVLEIRLIGPGAPYLEHAEFSATLGQLRLTRIVTAIDRIPHAAAIQQMLNSDALLLFQQSADARFQIPAKAYEYLRCARPTLTVAPDGATSNLMRKTGVGPVVAPDDVGGIARALDELIANRSEWEERVRRTNAAAPYDRRRLTHRLADILDSITSPLSAAH